MPLGLDLSESTAKVARAREHFETLKRECGIALNKRDPYTYRISEIDPETGWCTVFAIENYAPELGLGVIVGDLMHNLRCALDYIVTALVKVSPKARLAISHMFPIFANRDAYIEKIGLPSDRVGKGKLAGVVHGLDEIWRLQPFNGQPDIETHQLFVINRFSNTDKHRVVVNTFVLPHIIETKFTRGTVVERRLLAWDPLFPVSEQEIENVRFERPVPLETDVSVHARVRVWFGTPPSLDKRHKGQALPLELLGELCDTVDDIVERFRAI